MTVDDKATASLLLAESATVVPWPRIIDTRLGTSGRGNMYMGPVCYYV